MPVRIGEALGEGQGVFGSSHHFQFVYAATSYVLYVTIPF